MKEEGTMIAFVSRVVSYVSFQRLLSRWQKGSEPQWANPPSIISTWNNSKHCRA